MYQQCLYLFLPVTLPTSRIKSIFLLLKVHNGDFLYFSIHVKNSKIRFYVIHRVSVHKGRACALSTKYSLKSTKSDAVLQ